MGFRISEEFPSRFLNGKDIVGTDVPVTIQAVKKEKAFSKQKNEEEIILVVYFKDKKKGVVLKKTRANDLKNIVGSDDTDRWINTQVIMYTEKKNAGGKMVDSIRFKAP
jgi:hypothetical protein